MHGITQLVGFTSLAAASVQFFSRPELVYPKLNITVPATHDTEKGYIFVAPYHGVGNDASGPIQQGAYIFQDDGELVWSSLGHYSGFVANFRPVDWNGKVYLHAFHGTPSNTPGRTYGYHSLLGADYQTAKVLQTRSDKLPSLHEFEIVQGKTALLEVPIVRQLSLKPWGGDDQQRWIGSAGFQEVNIESGEVLFEWESVNHIDPNRSAFALNSSPGQGTGRNTSDPWDYFHLNSIDKDDEGNYLISARNTAALYKINGTDGEIIWQLGGLAGGSSFKIKEEDIFAYQHDARFLERSQDGKELLSLFDNGAHSDTVKTHPFSRARIFELNHRQGTAKAIKTLDAPDGLSAHTQGNAELLPNGNVFVNWGQAGAVTEFNVHGDVVFHSYLDSAPGGILVQNYRGFRANWTGLPSEVPAVVAYGTARQTEVDIYVSWNGDTETATWRFYVDNLPRQASFLGEVTRKGFETHGSFHVASADGATAPQVVAEAVDSDGLVLGHSASVPVTFVTGYGQSNEKESSWFDQDEL